VIDLRVGVTSGRKGAELADALIRRGARPVLGPTVAGDRPEPDDAIIGQTDAVLAARPAWLAASTGVGMRLWAQVAERHGRLARLQQVLGGTRRLARGAKAVGGLKGAFGLAPEWVADNETDAEVAARLVEEVEPGQVVVVQLHGGPSVAYDVVAGDAGAEVLTVLPYRSVLPDDTGPARRLVDQVVDGCVDLLVFTSPGAVHNLMAIAGECGRDTPARVREAIDGGAAIAAVGPVTAGACREAGLALSLVPSRARTGDLLRAIEAWSANPR
jgi:uroporphyrinogen-III synthase